jgi:integrase
MLVQPKTVNLEIGTFRAILEYSGDWVFLQPNVKMLPVCKDVGRALTQEYETTLLEACRQSRSRSLFVFVVVALYTGARFSLIRKLRWTDIDFIGCTVYFGGQDGVSRFRDSASGEPSDRGVAGMGSAVPFRRRRHYVFPTERTSGSGHHFAKMVPIAYETDPTKPMISNKTARQGAKKCCGVMCRIRDLRHTACSRMLDAGTPLPKITKLLGRSDSTTVMMARRYGRFSTSELREAVETINLVRSYLFPYLLDPKVSGQPSDVFDFYGS